MKTFSLLAACVVVAAACGDKVAPPQSTEADPAAHPHSAVLEGVAQESYRVVQVDGVHQADNPAQGLHASFDGMGWQLRPLLNDADRVTPLAGKDPSAWQRRAEQLARARNTPDWTLRLAFAGVGRADGVDARVSASPTVAPVLGACDGSGRTGALGQCFRRIEYQHPGVTEYVTNASEGLEHGYLVQSRPRGAGAYLAVATRVEGLTARATADGQTVRFADQGADRVEYAKLKVVDAAGKELPARMVAQGQQLVVLVEDQGATYPVHIDALATSASWSKDGEGTESNFGLSVAAVGDVNGDGYADVVVGSSGWSSLTGRAYLFHGGAAGLSTTAAWTKDGEETRNCFGFSVAGAGDVSRRLGSKAKTLQNCAATNAKAIRLHSSPVHGSRYRCLVMPC